LTPSISKRRVKELEVYSFFQYQDIESLILTKYSSKGYLIFSELGKIIFKPFIREFIKNYNSEVVYIIGIDEVVNNGYSHVALLTHSMKSRNVKVLHSKLLARNREKYAGKSLQFRLQNPRNFIYTGLSGIDAILVDDVITTGTTLKEATEVLKKNKVNILFALTLASL